MFVCVGMGIILVCASIACDGRPATPVSPTSHQFLELPPSVTHISPAWGATGGGAVVEIHGNGFRAGATVGFDDAAATVLSVAFNIIRVTSPTHDAGVANVVVKNPSGLAGQLLGAFTYAQAAQLSITRIIPNSGATAGGTYVAVAGTGFQPGMTVKLDEVELITLRPNQPGGIAGWTRHREPGTVDVVVTNPDGQTARLPGAFTYTAPDFVDFNGVWDAFAGVEGEQRFQFTVRDNMLASVSCVSARELSPGPSTEEGRFVLVTTGGVMSGGMVRPNYAEGTINIPGCAPYDTVWSGNKR
jgi:hypothetical protein